MEKVFFFAVLALLPLSSFADTKGLEGLKQYECHVVSESGKIEQASPIGRAVLAQSKNQAIAIYLMSIDANMGSRDVSVTVSDMRNSSNGKVSDVLKEVSCTSMN